ncbi:sugar ABC transporter permease [Paenibacillus sp. IB182496]|uniref:Sugar ABC transporter permease n=1 Tax=Paenibacillus sabuli TaxID=2772509 RepID=A0A927BPU2_9BACL|nr:ABC transporter permease subunit [Paenibacillus sabuli]MBD2844057.1 sugar ABC transporter permease [Paenibacillus sabuli]
MDIAVEKKQTEAVGAKKRSRWRADYPLHLMVLPGLLIVLVYHYLPTVGIVMAFQEYSPAKGFFRSEWVGWEHFEYIFKLPDFKSALYNTFFIATMKIVAGQVVPIFIAILLNEVGKTYFKRTVQTLIYLPHFLSWVILAGILTDILSINYGIVNQIIQSLGLEPIYFLGDNNWFPYTIVMTDLWKDFGWGTIIFLAAITGINPNLYEAAVVDGANRWKQTLHITLPGMMPIIALTATLSLGNVLNAGFDQIFNLYSPMVYKSGDIIDTLVYRIGLVDAQFSVGAAVGLFKSLVSFVLITVSYALAYKYLRYRIF